MIKLSGISYMQKTHILEFHAQKEHHWHDCNDFITTMTVHDWYYMPVYYVTSSDYYVAYLPPCVLCHISPTMPVYYVRHLPKCLCTTSQVLTTTSHISHHCWHTFAIIYSYLQIATRLTVVAWSWPHMGHLWATLQCATSRHHFLDTHWHIVAPVWSDGRSSSAVNLLQ